MYVLSERGERRASKIETKLSEPTTIRSIHPLHSTPPPGRSEPEAPRGEREWLSRSSQRAGGRSKRRPTRGKSHVDDVCAFMSALPLRGVWKSATIVLANAIGRRASCSLPGPVAKRDLSSACQVPNFRITFLSFRHSSPSARSIRDAVLFIVCNGKRRASANGDRYEMDEAKAEGRERRDGFIARGGREAALTTCTYLPPLSYRLPRHLLDGKHSTRFYLLDRRRS